MSTMALKKIEHAAAPKQLLTLDEVAASVQDAMRPGATGAEIVEVRASWGAKLQKIGVEIETVKDAARAEGP
jgi:hypothetical protein